VLAVHTLAICKRHLGVATRTGGVCNSLILCQSSLRRLGMVLESNCSRRMMRTYRKGASACGAIIQRLGDVFVGCPRFRRWSFSYSIRLISSISALSWSESCSTAACSHTCVHCSFAFPCITHSPIWQAVGRRVTKHMRIVQASGQTRVAPNRHCYRHLRQYASAAQKVFKGDGKISPVTGHNRSTEFSVSA